MASKHFFLFIVLLLLLFLYLGGEYKGGILTRLFSANRELTRGVLM